jgi:hypothetical protein
MIESVLARLNLYRRYWNWRNAGCIFVHVPKAAGTTINHALYGRSLGHYPIGEIRRAFPGLVNRCFVFSVVRNPYARALSAYRFAKAGRTADMGIAHPEKYRIPAFETFSSFVLDWLVHQDLERVDHVFRPQHRYVCIDGIIAVDNLYKLESLSEHIPAIEQRLGRALRLEPKNVVPGGDDFRLDFRENAIRDAVFGVYRKDFELLGYERAI